MAVASRRQFVKSLTAAALLHWNAGRSRAAEADAAVTFSFGTYGMKGVRTEDAIRTIAEIGYDGVELAVKPEWDAAPANMPRERRVSIRRLLGESGLKLTALMEDLHPSSEAAEHAAALERLKQAAGLGTELSPDAPPLIQTTLGGGRWEEVKTMYRDRLGDWADAGRRTSTVIAIKPHRSGAMSRPAEAMWLIEQLDRTPWLRMVFDYSHYAFRDLPLEETVRAALPWTAHIAVKDAVREGDKVAFMLPGASGTFDYAEFFRLVQRQGYQGDICCEVSGMVWGQPGYDPAAAAKTCYENISPHFKAAWLG